MNGLQLSVWFNEVGSVTTTLLTPSGNENANVHGNLWRKKLPPTNVYKYHVMFFCAKCYGINFPHLHDTCISHLTLKGIVLCLQGSGHYIKDVINTLRKKIAKEMKEQGIGVSSIPKHEPFLPQAWSVTQ